MKTLKTTDPLKLTYGNCADGRIFKSWRIYNREGAKLRTLATMSSENLSPEREHELCRLFAAAPELLEALQFVAGHCDPADKRHILPEQVASAVRAAIAKALGK